MATIEIASGAKPKYEHNCDKCEFLGRYKKDDVEYDLYYCSKHPVEEIPENLHVAGGRIPYDGMTVIGRYGDKENCYLEGMQEAIDSFKSDPLHPLPAALLVARSMKLLHINLEKLK